MEDLETVFDEITPPGVVATFSEGQTCVTAHGLHQWDYGAVLEIRDSALAGRVLAFHFAYPGAREAIVSGRAYPGSVCEVLIPDACLEQPAPVTVWVYETRPGSLVNTQGRTIRTIVLPIIPRARPAALPTMPDTVSNLYTETLTMVTAAAELAVANLERGAEVYAEAETAVATATQAAGGAEQALEDVQKYKQQLANGTIYVQAASKLVGEWTKAEGNSLPGDYGVFMVKAKPSGTGISVATLTFVVDFQGAAVFSTTSACHAYNDTNYKMAVLYVYANGGFELRAGYPGIANGMADVTNDFEFFYFLMGEVYNA